MMAKKPNGHAKTDDADKPSGIPTDTPENRARLAGRAAVDAISEHDDNAKRLRNWLRDTLDIGAALNHFDEDPDGARRELQNAIATGLNLDPDLTEQLIDRAEGNWPVEAEPERQVTEATSEPAAAPTEAATEEAAVATDPADDEQEVRVEKAPRIAALAARQLKGQLTRYILDRLQHEQGDRRPWSERTESHQRATIAQVGDMVESALRDAFSMMIAERTHVVTGKLESVTAKEDGIKAVVKVRAEGNADSIMSLLTGAGETVQIAVADPTAFLGYAEQVPVVLDQHVMPLEPEQPAAAETQTEPEPGEVADAGDDGADEGEQQQAEVLDAVAASMASQMPADPPAPVH